jgi:PilZ domain
LIPNVIKLFATKLEERRREERFEMTLPGRYRLGDGQEYPCWTIDVSLSGVAIRGFGKGEVGESVVADIGEIGRVEGMIARHLDEGLAVRIDGPAAKRQRLAQRIARLVRGGAGD